MSSRVTHPSKEQVRTYMAARCTTHCPPPSPKEIQRKLGWYLMSCNEYRMLQLYLIPTNYMQVILNWMFTALHARRR